MNPTTKNEVLEALENTKEMMMCDIPETPQIGTKENPLICNISIARAMKTDYNGYIWVSIFTNKGMKLCQLKEIK